MEASGRYNIARVGNSADDGGSGDGGRTAEIQLRIFRAEAPGIVVSRR